MSIGLRSRAERAGGFLRALGRELREEDVAFMARSVAFSAFLSVLPLILLFVIAATAIGGEGLATRVQAVSQQYLMPAARGLVGDALARASNQIGFSLFGLVFLLWGVRGVFRGLDTAFSKLYDAPRNEGVLDQLSDALVVFVAITVAVLAMIVLAVGLQSLRANGPLAALSPTAVDAVGRGALIVALAIAFFPLYYVFPDVSVTARGVLPGTVVAAVGWAGLQAGFQLYVEFSSTNQLYGAIGGVILLLTWLYLGAALLLVGGAVNVVLTDRHRAKTATVPGSSEGQAVGEG